MLFTTLIWSSKLGLDISTKWIKKSASLTSSKVDLNDSTNWVGNFLINPTVSVSKKGVENISTGNENNRYEKPCLEIETKTIMILRNTKRDTFPPFNWFALFCIYLLYRF